jgi:hypothetical protein
MVMSLKTVNRSFCAYDDNCDDEHSQREISFLKKKNTQKEVFREIMQVKEVPQKKKDIESNALDFD